MTLDYFKNEVLCKIPTIDLENSIGFAPVLYFGDLKNAEVATISINPSDKEFLDGKGRILSGSNKRLESLHSLKRTNWNGLTQKKFDTMLDSYDNYFNNNPYSWFNALENILNYNGYSYFKNKNLKLAAHLDICCMPTKEKWGEITKENQTKLKEFGLPILAKLLKEESPNLKTIVINGKTVYNSISKYITNPETNTSSFIQNNKTKVQYKGEMSNLCNIELGKVLKVVGWSTFISSNTIIIGPDKF